MAKEYKSAPPMTIDPNKKYTVTIETTEGVMTAELFPKDAPGHVNSFVVFGQGRVLRWCHFPSHHPRIHDPGG